jgi:hypothetical protein
LWRLSFEKLNFLKLPPIERFSRTLPFEPLQTIYMFLKYIYCGYPGLNSVNKISIPNFEGIYFVTWISWTKMFGRAQFKMYMLYSRFETSYFNLEIWDFGHTTEWPQTQITRTIYLKSIRALRPFERVFNKCTIWTQINSIVIEKA